MYLIKAVKNTISKKFDNPINIINWLLISKSGTKKEGAEEETSLSF